MKKALSLHKKLKGKVEIRPKVSLSKNNLHLLYTPGVAEVNKAIARDAELADEFTGRANAVAVVTDGSRGIGVGNASPESSLPVMEGKAMMFHQFAKINAYPLSLGTKDEEEIVNAIAHLAPSFGAFNLEDIESPKCFSVLEKVRRKGILAFHDDSEGSAIIVMAGLFNALRVAGKSLKEVKICVAGAGAAGYGLFRLLSRAGVSNMVFVDVRGMIYKGRKRDDSYLREIAAKSNPQNARGKIRDALWGADVFIGFSGVADLISARDISHMRQFPIVFALSNPVPEISEREIRKASRDFVYATGRSGEANQINNALVFPGVFRGMLDSKKQMSESLALRIAERVASLVKRPSRKAIVPGMFDRRLVREIRSCFPSL